MIDATRIAEAKVFLDCPRCGVELLESKLNGLRVERCTACNGLWLDAGVLVALGDSFQKWPTKVASRRESLRGVWPTGIRGTV